ncbi:hypothetical protein COCON_G00052450 [Conger conger]|uniref:Cadherin domain-containing protein n=1 Tax=Conger conger TaxID=82655 RepID=A0A9Q1DVR4_CONCO|nr:hypothetical protein COCON_G00052450 [Conger conger]
MTLVWLLILAPILVGYVRGAPTINTLEVEVREDTPVGDFAFQIDATDTSGVPLKYAFITTGVYGDAASYFSVDENTGRVALARLLDRESTRVIRPQIEVTSDGPTRKAILVILGDANDNKPAFQNGPFNVEVPENTAVGTSLFFVNATDSDFNAAGIVTYSISSAREANLNVNGIRASSTAEVDITVLDINDNKPLFYACDSDPCDFTTVAHTFSCSVEEQSSRGVPVAGLNMAVRDLDDGQNAVTNIHLEGPGKDVFSVIILPQSSFVQISINRPLEVDYEENTTMTVQVVATDPSITGDCCSTATVTIKINDTNDNAPTFQKETYSLEVKEHSAVGTIIATITARDDDEQGTDNSRMRFEIVPSEFSQNFTIDEFKGILENNGPLDREALDPLANGVIKLNVSVHDMGVPSKSAYVTVLINVEVNNRISFDITEGSLATFAVTAVQEADGTGYIGNIALDQDIELDYEQQKGPYIFSVVASDTDGKKDVARVEVHVKDVNDERPQFPSGQTVEVKENTNETVVGKVEGNDLDGNHMLMYELLSSKCRCESVMGPCQQDWFNLLPSGDVTVNPEIVIDYEECDQATDRDAGNNKDITFSILNMEFVSTDNTASEETLFQVNTAAVENAYVGTIRAQGTLDSERKGKYVITVEAKNGRAEPELKNSTVIEIYTIDSSFRVELYFSPAVDQINENIDQIRSTLASATKATVHILRTISVGQVQRATALTLLEAYFVYLNGTAMQSEAVEKVLQEDLYNANKLSNLGLTGIVSGVTDPTVTDPVRFILLGLIGGLLIVLIVMITSLVCTQRNYKRKLKASKALQSDAMVATENQKPSAIVPGSNQMKANPVLNLIIDTTTDLGFDEEDSCTDKVSVNSLDYNIDLNMTEKDTAPMMVIEEENEEENEYHLYVEPLDFALASRGEKRRAPDAPKSFVNPILDTTDL